jgi:hypothetical protein
MCKFLRHAEDAAIDAHGWASLTTISKKLSVPSADVLDAALFSKHPALGFRFEVTFESAGDGPYEE